MNDKKETISQAQVVLIPDQRDQTRLYRTVMSGSNGRFSLPNLRPGSYKLFAWEGPVDPLYFDSSFLLRYEAQGTAVHILESEKTEIDLEVLSVSHD